MKKLRVALVALCLALPGCYDFDFPLDPKPQVAVDPRLVGTWRCLGAEPSIDDAPANIRIERRTQTTTHWAFESPAADGTPEKADFDVHGSSVKGGALLNVLEVGEKANGKWSFARYTFISPDILRLQLVDDKPLEKVKGNVDSLRKAIEKRRDDPAIYIDYCVCVRVKSSPEPSPSPSPTP